MTLALPWDHVAAIRAEFAEQNTFKIEGFVNGDLLERMKHSVATDEFAPRTDEGIGHELCMSDNVSLHALRLTLNDAEVYKFVEEVTGCDPIQCFHGRIYKFLPGGGYFDSWHDDFNGQRMVGMSINLSPLPYEGGVFQIKKADSDDVIRSMPNTGLGDAIFFRIAEDLKHQVSQLEGINPKIAYAGWFQNAPKFMEVMHEMLRERAQN